MLFHKTVNDIETLSIHFPFDPSRILTAPIFNIEKYKINKEIQYNCIFNTEN